jgi:hypothetical protein
MPYQSKTYSLSDEVIAAIEAAREQGETPNRFFLRLLGLNFGCPTCGNLSIGVISGIPVFLCKHEPAHNGKRYNFDGRAAVLRPKGDVQR